MNREVGLDSAASQVGHVELELPVFLDKAEVGHVQVAIVDTELLQNHSDSLFLIPHARLLLFRSEI